MGQLALDTDVYKRLSVEVLACRCYEPGETAGSRTQLIFGAVETCDTQPEMSQRLAPILQMLKSDREKAARVADGAPSGTVGSPVPTIAEGEEWVLRCCRDEWAWLEGSLDSFTLSLFEVTLSLCRLRTKLKAQITSKSESPSQAALGRIWQQVQDVCLTTAVVDPVGDQSLLNRAPSKLGETFSEDPHLRPFVENIIDRLVSAWTSFQPSLPFPSCAAVASLSGSRRNSCTHTGARG